MVLREVGENQKRSGFLQNLSLPELRNRDGSARGPRAGLGGSPKPSFTFFVRFWREKVCGTGFSASRRKPHASGVRSLCGCAALDFDFGIRAL